MTLSDLRTYLERVKLDKVEYFGALMQYYKKFSIPVACLAMGLLALPLGIQTRNSKKGFGIGLGLFFFLLYYILLSMGTAFGENGSYPPVIGMWMPNVIIGGFGIILLVRSAREKQLTFKWLRLFIDRAMKWVDKK
jgi:lipopolysaccharide export system permease protein